MYSRLCAWRTYCTRLVEYFIRLVSVRSDLRNVISLAVDADRLESHLVSGVLGSHALRKPFGSNLERCLAAAFILPCCTTTIRPSHCSRMCHIHGPVIVFRRLCPYNACVRAHASALDMRTRFMWKSTGYWILYAMCQCTDIIFDMSYILLLGRDYLGARIRIVFNTICHSLAPSIL